MLILQILRCPSGPSNAASNMNTATGRAPSAAETRQIVLKEIGVNGANSPSRSCPGARMILSPVGRQVRPGEVPGSARLGCFDEGSSDLTQGFLEVEIASCGLDR